MLYRDFFFFFFEKLYRDIYVYKFNDIFKRRHIIPSLSIQKWHF